jgi:GMP synthase-like glutamine amidotransferase
VTRVGILETGIPLDSIIQRHGTFPQMFCTYFAGQPDLKFDVFSVVNKSPVPRPSDCDAWIITGSRHAVYEDHPWLPPLRDFVRLSVEQSIPTLGICFGHQLMAQAFGGTVAQSDRGRGIGIHHYALSPTGQKIFSNMQSFRLPVAHQDQVIDLPPNAVVLARSEFCPHAALAYGNAGMSLQAHPEFTVDGASDIMDGWQERAPVAQEIVNAAKATLSTGAPDSSRLAPVLRDFLTRRLAV